jgi:predicted nucleotidyltransferase
MALQQTGHDLAGIEQMLHEALAREGRSILAAYLFGSTARGTARGHSDIDVAVLLAETPHTLGERFGLESRLEERLRRILQVVILNGAPPDLVHRILRDGRLVLESDKAARVRFEVSARNAYFDVLPALERYRRPRQVGGTSP